MLSKTNYYFMVLLTSACVVVMLLFSYLIVNEFLAVREMKHVIRHDLDKVTHIVDKSNVEISANKAVAESIEQEGNVHLSDTMRNAYITMGILFATAIALIFMWISIYRRLRYVGNIQINEKQLKELLHYTQANKISVRANAEHISALDKQEQNSFIAELKTAVHQNQFVLYYQPVINVQTQQIAEVETLLRWQHPVHGLLSPDKFLSLYELTELIIPLGKWIIQNAIKQLKVWHEMGYSQLSIAINLSAKQLNDPALFDVIREAISINKLSADKIQLEITESIVIDNTTVVIPFLNKIKNLGVKLSLDDFGTGYSSLSYLKQFPFDVLKVDKSFVKDMTSDPTTLAIIESIIALAKSLGLLVIAEGVCNNNELAMLKKLQCDWVQGFLYSEPLAPSALTDYLISFGKKPLAQEEA